MSREVDARVVSMYFDNKNFEKNAKSTIETLDELKKNLDIEKSIKGFDKLKKVGEDLKLDEIGRKVQNLKGVFAGLGDAVTKVFNIGTAPLRPLENLFNTFQGYVTKFLGFDLAGKLVGGIESAVRQLTIAPVEAGWNLYESKMDSIKTIMSGTGESLEVVTGYIERLNTYANDTVYSFGDMVSNIGKFTNNKVALEDATIAMQGIANATADAGQGAQQASMAMYNISQAIGVGSMKMVDWKSLENANIATVRLKETFMEAGVASGKLVKKITKDAKTGETVTKYYVKGFESGKKAVEVTAENFRETLNKEWLDKDAMLKAFKIYSGEIKSVADLRAMGFSEALGFTDEDLQRMIGIGEAANNSATQVRTFTKMFDALKEAVESGWSKSFEWIFGNMEEGTNFWTELNNKIGAILDKASADRNDALAGWRGMFKDRDNQWRKQVDMWKTEYQELNDDEKTALEDEAKTLQKEIDELEQKAKEADKTGPVYGAGGKAGGKSKGSAEKAEATKYRQEAEEKKKRLKEVEGELARGKAVQVQIMEAAEDGREVLMKSFMELLDVLISVGGAVSEAWEAVFGKFSSESMWAFTNAFKGFVDRVKAWLGTADNADSRLSKITKGLKGVFSILKVVLNFAKNSIKSVINFAKPLLNIAVDLFGVFGDFFGDIGDMNLGEMLAKIGEGFTLLWNKLTSLGWDGVLDGFSNLWGSIKSGVKDWLYDNGLGAVWETLSSWKAKIAEVWAGIKQWFEDSGIAGFFRDAWTWITTQFTAPNEYDDRGFKKNTKSPVEQLLSDTWDGIKSTWEQIKTWPVWYAIGKFISDTVSWVSATFSPKKRYDDRGFELNDHRSPAVEWLGNIWEGIKAVWNQIKAWPVWSVIGQFISNVVDWVVRFFSPKKRYDSRGFELNDNRSPAVELLGNIWEGIKAVWNQIKAWPVWSVIGQFISNVVDWVVRFFSPKKRYDSRGFELNDNRSPAVELLGNIWEGIKAVWNQIKAWPVWSVIGQFISNVVDWVVRFFSPKKRYDSRGFELNDNRSPAAELLENVWDAVKAIWDRITKWEGWQEIGKFLGDTFDWIKSFFSAGSETTTEVSSGSGDTERSASLLERVLKALGDFWEKVKSFVGQVAESTGLSAAMELVKKVFEILAEIITVVINFIHSVVVDKDLLANLQAMFLIIGAIIAKLVLAKWGAQISASDGEGIGETILKICLGVLAVAGAIALLTMVDQEKMWEAVKIVAVIGVVIGVLIAILKFKKKDEEEETDEPVKAWERVVNNLVKWAAILGIVWVTIKSLPELLSAIGSAGLNGADFLGVITGILEMIAGVTLIVALLAKLKIGQDVKAMALSAVSVLAAVGIIIGGFAALFLGIGGLLEVTEGEENVDRLLKKGADSVETIGRGIGQFFGGIAAGFNDVKSEEAKKQLENIDKMSEEFTPERLTSMSRVMSSVKEISDMIPDAGGIIDYLSPGKKNFLTAMGQIGEAIAKFGESIHDGFADRDMDPEKALNDALNAMEGMKNLAEAIADFKTITSDWVPGETIDVSGYESIGRAYGQAASLLAKAVQEGLDSSGSSDLKVKFDATPIIDSIVTALGYGETGIAAAVHAMVQAGINKSNNPNGGVGGYDTSPLFNNNNGGINLNSLLGDKGLDGLLGTFDVNSLFGEGGLQGVISGAIEGLNTDSLGSMFAEKAGGMFSMDTLFGSTSMEDYLKNWLPTDENGNLKFSEEFLGDWSGKMTDLSTLLDESGAKLEVQGSINYESLETDVANYSAAGGLKVKITPIFDATSLDEGIRQINSYFENHPIIANLNTGLPDMTINADNHETIGAIKDVRDSVQTLTRQLVSESYANVSAINRLSSDIYSVSRAVSAMRIYLDTGVIAGAVDDALGIQMLLAGRTGG